MSLTAFAIDAARPRNKPFKIVDGDGLHLLAVVTAARTTFGLIAEEHLANLAASCARSTAAPAGRRSSPP